MGGLSSRQRPRDAEPSSRVQSVAGAEGGLFLATLHPHIIGHRSRIVMLARLVDHMKQHGPVWFAIHEQVALWRRDRAAGTNPTSR